jgi:hypothetical protein
MQAVEEWIVSGRIVSIMLAVLLLEAALLLALFRMRGKGIAPRALLINLGAGGSLMVALYCALTAADWRLLALSLVASLCFHVADLRARWT